MSNWHVLERNGNQFRLAYHVAIPNTNNSASVNYRIAVVNSKLGGVTVLPDGDGTSGTISAAEKSSILAGAIIERIVNLDPYQGNPGTSGTTVIANVNADYTANSAELLADLQAKLLQFGRTG